jgi:hypothetical protein
LTFLDSLSEQDFKSTQTLASRQLRASAVTHSKWLVTGGSVSLGFCTTLVSVPEVADFILILLGF